MRSSTHPTSTPLDRLGHATTVAEAGHYEATLRARRMSAVIVGRYLQVVAHFVEWAARVGDDGGGHRDISLDASATLPVCVSGTPHPDRESRGAAPLAARDRGRVMSAASGAPVDVEVTAYDRYLHDVCGVAVQTRVRRTRHVRAFLTHVFSNEPIRYLPNIQPSTLTRLVTTRAQQVRPSGVRTEDLVKAGDNVDDIFQPGDTLLCVLLGGDAGLRCGEMMALTWNDVDLKKRQLCVQHSDWKGHVTTTKGGRLRHVPMTMRLAAALKQHRHLRSERVLCTADGQPLTQKMVRALVIRVSRRAGLAKAGVHILRHTFCSHLAMRGAPARAIQELAGHMDLSTTQRYMHLSPAAVEAAIRLLDTAPQVPGRGDIVETAQG